jgi:hypothetical protein
MEGVEDNDDMRLLLRIWGKDLLALGMRLWNGYGCTTRAIRALGT